MNIPTGISRPLFRGALLLKKSSPNIMFVGGLAGVVTSTVLACRATLRLSEALPEMKADLEAVRAETEDPAEQRRAIAMVYGLNAGKVAKLYSPAILVGGASVCALTGSHVTLTRRNAGLTAAYAAMASAYEEYRVRVQGELGGDREHELYRGGNSELVKTPEGKQLQVDLSAPNKRSPYSCFFDEYSRNWQKQAEFNRLFVQVQQTYSNERLRAHGHVFLNEVYDLLGVPRTPAGAVAGWIYNSERGDSYIDFGLDEPDSERFMLGWEQSVLLDFNVDGVIWNLI